MSNAVRRRLAAGGGLLAGALVAGLLVTTTGASAAGTASPPTGFNDQTAVDIEFALTDGSVPAGSRAQFVKAGEVAAPTVVFEAQVEESPPSASVPPVFRSPRVTVNLADPTYTTAPTGTDGPADPGTYTVRFLGGTVSSSAGQVVGECASCFTVQTRSAPTATTAAPSGLQRSATAQEVVFTGGPVTGFARGTVVEVLGADGKPDAAVTVAQTGVVTPTRLPRRVTVAAGALLGARDVRLTNPDGQSSLCRACFSVLGAPFGDVQPRAAVNNESARTLVFTAAAGAPFPADAAPALEYDVATTGSSTRQGLRLTPTSVSRAADGSTLTAVFDVRGAAPGADAYLPTVTSASGGVSTSAARFSVSTPAPPVVSGVAPATQRAGTAQRVTVSGTGFARGALVTLTGGNAVMPVDTVTATSVEFVSPTTLSVLFTVPANAPAGDRAVVVTNTNGERDDLPAGYEVQAAATPSATASSSTSPTASPTASATPSRSATPTATATATPTVSPSRSATPTATPTATASPTASPPPSRVAPRLTLPRSTITSQEAASVEATGEPGSVVELLAYSRPSTRYVRVRRTVLSESGRVVFSVQPSGNTRMFLRTSDVGGAGVQDSPSVVLTVRTGINLKVARTGPLTYRFTGSTLPKRAGQTVNVRYVRGDGSVVASKVRVAADGTYNVTRRFTGTGTFTFFTNTGTDINNAAGTSNAVRTTVR